MADESSFLIEIVLKAIDQASGPIKNLNRAVDDLKSRSSAGRVTDDLSRGLDDVGSSARQAEGDVRSHREEVGRHTDTVRQHREETSRAADTLDEHASSAAAARAPVRALTGDTEKSTSAVKDHAQAVAKVTDEYRNWTIVSRQAGLSNAENSRALGQISREAEQLTRVLPRASQAWRDMSSVAGEARRAAKQSGVADEVERLTQSYRNFDQMARSGRVTASAAKDSYRDFATSFDRLRDSIDKGSESWRRLGRVIDDATKKARNAKAAVSGGGLVSGFAENLGRAFSGEGLSGFDRALQNLAAHADNFGIKIVSLSAQMRGLALATVVGLFQQFDTAVVGAVGALFSLGSAAAQAAATVGGTFVAALGQAIPVIGLVADAFNRLRMIIQAVQAAQNLQQQQATTGSQQQISALSNTNAVISAQQNLANSYVAVARAQEGVRMAQLNLTIARRDAQRQIVDLMYAEQQAELQARGANITLAQAQQNLQRVILQGGTGTALSSAQLQVDESRLGLRQARTAVPRARQDAARAQAQGVSGAPAVIAATQAVTQSRQALVQAEQAVGNASRQLRIAQLQAAQTISSIATAAHQLQYLLSSLSPVERQIYGILTRFASYFRNPSSPFNRIADHILAPFVGGFRRVFQLLNDSNFLAPFDRLARTMGESLHRLFGTLLGRQGTSFLDQMATMAARNIPIITSSLSALIKIFEDIARAAGPALHVFIQDFNKFITGLAARWSTPQGLKELTAFFNQGARYAEDFVRVGGALLQLLLALGRDAAPAGGSLLEGWVGSLNRMTQWVQSHGPEVRTFFRQAGQALNIFLGFIGQLGLALVKLMDTGALRGFAQLLQNVIVPVLADAFRVLGFFTNALVTLFNAIPGLRTFVTVFGGLAVAAIALGKLYAPLRGFITLLLGLKEGAAAFQAFRLSGAGLIESLTAAKLAVSERLAAERGIVAAIQAQTAALGEQLVVQRELVGGAATQDVLAAGGAGAGATRAGAGLTTAETAGGGGFLASLGGASGVASAALGPVAIGGAALWIATHTGGPHPGTTSPGLGSVLGPVGGSHTDKNILDRLNPFAGTGFLGLGPATSPDQSASTTQALKRLQDGLRGVSDPAQLSSEKLAAFHREAQRILQLPDITRVQRRGAEQLVPILDPVNVALRQMQAQWVSTFSGISATSGNVMKQVKQVLKQDISDISINLGTGTKQGTQALQATIASAWQTVKNNTSAAVRNTHAGMVALNAIFDRALKALGVNVPSGALLSGQTIGFLSAAGGMPAISQGGSPLSSNFPTRASGGWNPARPGGSPYIAGEAGHDEVTLTTDPRHGARQASLLQEFFARAPHMASGGFVAEPGTDFSFGEEPRIVAALTRLADALNVTIYGISGHRTPAHSRAVGGFSDDPHTRGEAADIGVNSALRSSAAQLSNATLARFGLWRPFDMSGQNPAEVNHIQLLPGAGGPSIGGITAPRPGQGIAGAIAALVAPKIAGVKGLMQNIAQGGTNLVTRTANQILASVGGAGGGMDTNTAGLSGNLIHIVRQLAGRFGWTGQVQDWLNVISRESSGSMTARNPSSGAYGIAQFINGASEYFTYGGNPNTLGGQLLAMANYIRQRYVTPAAAWAHELRDNWYDIGGRIGGKAPWGGRAVPIVAHEGERISNPDQWAHMASMVGMSPEGLDSHMGYTSKRSGLSYQDGGAPVASTARAGTHHLTLADVNWNSLESIGQLTSIISRTFRKLNDIGARSSLLTKKFTPFIDSLLVQDTGVFDRLNTAFTVIQSMLQAATVLGRRAAGRGLPANQRGYLNAIRAPYRVTSHGVTEVMTPDEIDRQQVISLNEQRRYLVGEQSLVGRALSQVRSRLGTVRALARRDPAKYASALQSLTTEYNNLLGRMRALTGTIAQNVSDTFSARQSRTQDFLSRVSDIFSTQQQRIQGEQSTAQATGNFSQLPSLDQALADSATSELKALQPVLKQAKKTGDQSLVRQIEQQMDQLRATAAQAAVQALVDAQSAIDQVAQTGQAQVSEYQSIAQTMEGAASTPAQFAAAGSLNQKALELNQSNLQTQLSGYNSLLGKAVSAGDTGLVNTLTQTIDQLTAQLVQNYQALSDNTAQMVQQTASYIQSRGQFQTGVYSGLASIITTIGQTTGSTDVGALAGLARAGNAALQGTNSGLLGQLGQLGGGASGLANMLSGLTDPAQIVSVLAGSNLSGIESGQSATWINAFEGIISSLETNTGAIAQNNQQLATLNGQLLQPQQWSTTAWTAFRTAIFSGMGNLLPQFQASLPPGSAPSIAPVFSSAGAGTTAPSIGELHLTHPVQVLDPQVLGEQIAFEMSNRV